MRRGSALIVLLPFALAFIFFAFPFFFQYQSSGIEWAIYKPLLRTAIVAGGTTGLSLLVGVVVGWSLFCYQTPTRIAAWLLVPFCLGSAAWAVLFLPVISRLPGIANRETWSVLLTLVIINSLQYGPLIAFVSYQSFVKTNTERHSIISATQMTASEAAELIFWPDLIRFLAFVGAVVFCSAFEEYEKSLLYFRASSGTDSSLVAQATRDIYMRLHAFHHVALVHVFSTSVVVVAFSALILVMTLLIFVPISKTILQVLATRMRLPDPDLPEQASTSSMAYRYLAGGALTIFVASCCWSFIMSDGLIIRDVVSVFVASTIATTIYTAYAFLLRLSNTSLWRMESTNARWLFAASLLLIRLIPGTLLFYLVVSYTVLVERQADAVRWMGWFFSHLFYDAAIVLPFLVLMLLRVSNNELDLLRASSVSNWDTSKVSLLSRFSQQLLIVFLFVFVLIWNGDAANSAMSSIFQSANLEIVTSLHGRKFNVVRSAELVLPTISLAVLAISLLVSPGNSGRTTELSLFGFAPTRLAKVEP
jgi:hypothetical protein